MLNPTDVVKERYKVIRLLGKGGLSYVYEVEDLELPKRWALKEFHPRNLGPEDMEKIRLQFKREVEILSGLHHPRLPAISDSFMFDERDYMVMELIEGKTLDVLIGERHGDPFPEDTVREWSLQILEILEYLHGQSPPVIYRDIKPQNIIISPESGVRFIDFGIARLFNPVKDQDTIFMGTPGFAPPEQFRQRQTDVRSDIYSLGATMHYLLTLKDPGANPFDFEPLSLSHASISPLMEKIVQKAVEIKAENRFQNASDMRRVLLGTLAFDDLFSQSFMILEPREIAFLDVEPSKKHSRQFTVKNSAGTPVKGSITSQHPGLKVEPSQFDAPQTVITISPENRQFPRGEKIISAVVISTENAKISVPVTLEFRPTLIRGLSPAMASIIFFIIPILSSIIWISFFLEPARLMPWAATSLLIALAIIAGSCAPSRCITKTPLLLICAFFFAFIPLAKMVMRMSPISSAMFSAIISPFLMFFFFAALINLFIFRLALHLTSAQRAEMKLIILASFFIFPALLYIIPSIHPMGRSVIFNLHAVSFIIASLLSLIFASFIGCFIIREKRESLCQAAPKRSAEWIAMIHLLTTLALAAFFGLLWYFICIEQGTLASRNEIFAFLPHLQDITRWSIFLPLTAQSYYPYGTIVVICVATALATLFYYYLPRVKTPIRVLMPLLFLGIFVNLIFSLQVMVDASRAQFRELLAADPEKVLVEIRAQRSGFEDDDLIKYYGTLMAGFKKAAGGSIDIACKKFTMAEKLLSDEDRKALTGKKLTFLINQARIWNIRDTLTGMDFTCFEHELSMPVGSTLFSSKELDYFSSQKRSGARGRSLYVIPDSCLFFFTAPKRCIGFSNDYEVLAATRFYQGLLCEFRGMPAEGKTHFRKMQGYLQKTPRSEIGRILGCECAERMSLYEKIPDLEKGKERYYNALASYYRKNNNNTFALPLYSYQIEHFPADIFKKTDLIETLYELGATQRGDAIIDKIIESIKAGDGDRNAITYITGIRDAAHYEFLSSYYHLASLREDRIFGNNPRFLLKLKNVGADLRYWNLVISLSEELERKWPSRLSADDYLKWAWSLDITGKFDKAGPHYRRYAELMSTQDPDSKRLIIVNNRLAGGPIPTFIVLVQLKINPDKHRVLVMGEGVPPECLPDVHIFHGLKESPVVTTSPNIRLEKKSDFKMKNYVNNYHRVVFLNPEEEKQNKSWRFYCSYDYTTASYFPMKIGLTEASIFNCKFVKDISYNYTLPSDYEKRGIYEVLAGGHRFVVVPRFRFNGGKDDALRFIDEFMGWGSYADYTALQPQNLFGLFSLEKGDFTERRITRRQAGGK
jgi:serine/threonine protein kinase